MPSSTQAGECLPAPATDVPPDVSRDLDRRSLLELVLDVAQIQYEMESRCRSGLSTGAMGQVEGRLLTELHERGLPIPPQAPR